MTSQLIPMIPADYADYSSKVRWDNATAQPYFKGQRCFVYFEKNEVKIVTTDNVQIKTVPHINNAFQYALSRKPETIIDGFLIHDELDDVELKKHLKKLNHDNSKIRFEICDQISDQPFMLRFKSLEYFISGPINCAETVKIRNREDLNFYQSRCVSFSYPAICLRHSTDGYIQGKASCFLKVNTGKNKDFFVIDFKPGFGEYAGLGVVVCETKDAEEFEVVCPKSFMTLSQLSVLFSSKPPKKLTVAYFDLSLGEDSIPRFPVAVRFK